MVEGQEGVTWEHWLALAEACETAGLEGLFRSDHYLSIVRGGEAGSLDAWTTIAALAARTERIRLGTLVSPVTFRPASVLAKAVATAQEISGGRVELGIGAGWYEREHQSYAIPFPPLGERFERLAEQLAIITGLWSTPVGEPFSFTGRHYAVTDSPALPKPVQPGGVPVIVGGGGPRRTPALAARHAAEFNTAFMSLDRFREQRQRVADACTAIGRDPATMTYSAALVVCVGKDEAEIARRAIAIGQAPADLRSRGIAGTPDEARETLEQWSDAGADRVYLQVLDLGDLDHLDAVAEIVA